MEHFSVFEFIVLVFNTSQCCCCIYSHCFHQPHFQLQQAASFSQKWSINPIVHSLPSTKRQPDEDTDRLVNRVEHLATEEGCFTKTKPTTEKKDFKLMSAEWVKRKQFLNMFAISSLWGNIVTVLGIYCCFLLELSKKKSSAGKFVFPSLVASFFLLLLTLFQSPLFCLRCTSSVMASW